MSLKFDILGDSSDFIAATRQAEAASGTLSNKVTKDGRAIDSMFKTMAASAGAFFSVQAGAQFVKQMANIRGEFQQLEVAFTTMLGGSKEKADALMDSLVELAATTPFDLQGVANGARQLLAYGDEVENITEDLTRLGNIAAGLSQPLGDLVYLYGTTMTQGRLYTQDLNQFTGRGIPMIRELAKVFGVAEGEVRGLVEAGKIGFPEVQAVIRNLTNEGGMFYNLMGEQSKTINGQISNLKDNIDMMFNEIGESQEGVISDAINLANKLVDNYKEVGSILGTLIGMYGAYRASLIAVTAARKAQTAILREAVQQKALAAAQSISLSKAEAVEAARVAMLNNARKKLLATTKALGKTLLANPYGIAAAAVVGFAAGTTRLTEAISEGAFAQKRFNEYVEEQDRVLSEANKRQQEHIEALIKAFGTEDKWTEAIKRLTDSYPELLEKYDSEKILLQDIKTLKEDIEEIDRRRSYDADIAELERLRRQTESYAASPVSKIGATSSVAELAAFLKNDQAIKQIELLEQRIYDGRYDDFLMIGPPVPDQRETEESEARNKAYWESIKKAAQEELDALTVAELSTKKASEIRRRIYEADSNIAKYSSKSSKTDVSAAEERLASLKTGYSEDSIREMEDLINRQAQAEIDAMADGAEKIRRQRDLDNKIELQDIERQKEDYISALVASDKEIWEAEQSLESAKNPEYRKVGFDELASRKAAESKAGGIFDSIYSDIQKRQTIDRIREEEEALEEYLISYGSYEERRLAITRKYERMIAAATTQGESATLSRRMEEDLYDLEKEYGKTASAIQDLFSDLGDRSAYELDAIADRAEAALNFIKGGKWSEDNPFGLSEEAFNEIRDSPSELNDIAEAIKNIRTQADALEGPIERIADGIKEMFDADKGSKDFEDALKNIYDGLSDIESIASFVAENIRSLADSFGSDAMSDVSEGIDSALSVVGSTMSGAKAGSVFGPWGAAAGAAIGLVSSLVSEISKLGDAAKQDTIDDLAEQNERLERSYESLGDEIERAYSVDASGLINQQNELLRQQRSNLRAMIYEESSKKNVNEDQIAEWNEAIEDIDRQIEDNAEKAMEAVAGISFDSFRDKYLEALLDMEGGTEEFASDIEETIRKAMYDALIAEKYDEQLQGLYKDLAEAVESGDASEIARIKQMIMDLYDAMGEEGRKIDESIGYEEESTRSSSSKGIAQASQDSVDELNGRATAIQSHTYSINEKITAMSGLFSQSLARLASIDANTSRLSDIEDVAKDMRAFIDNMNTKGVKIRP